MRTVCANLSPTIWAPGMAGVISHGRLRCRGVDLRRAASGSSRCNRPVALPWAGRAAGPSCRSRRRAPRMSGAAVARRRIPGVRRCSRHRCALVPRRVGHRSRRHRRSIPLGLADRSTRGTPLGRLGEPALGVELLLAGSEGELLPAIQATHDPIGIHGLRTSDHHALIRIAEAFDNAALGGPYGREWDASVPEIRANIAVLQAAVQRISKFVPPTVRHPTELHRGDVLRAREMLRIVLEFGASTAPAEVVVDALEARRIPGVGDIHVHAADGIDRDRAGLKSSCPWTQHTRAGVHPAAHGLPTDREPLEHTGHLDRAVRATMNTS